MNAPAMKRRLILGGFVAIVLTGVLVIGLAGFGRIPPEPTLSIVGIVCGSIVLLTSAWHWTRRHR